MTTTAHPLPHINLLVPGNWSDYELLDSGAGANGAARNWSASALIASCARRSGAIWPRALPERDWAAADGVFATADEEGAGRWEFRRPVDARWAMRYGDLRFWAQPTPFRHLGVFPEQASQWDWMRGLIRAAGRPLKVLNLFGYTGLATLAAAAAGASVTHVDASQKAMAWARENQTLSGLADRPIRWLVDDALKFVRREVRREARYDGLDHRPAQVRPGAKGRVVEAGGIAAGAARRVPVAAQRAAAVRGPDRLRDPRLGGGPAIPARTGRRGTRGVDRGRRNGRGRDAARDGCCRARSTRGGAGERTANANGRLQTSVHHLLSAICYSLFAIC